MMNLKKRVERLSDKTTREIPKVAIIEKIGESFTLTLSEAGVRIKETKSIHKTITEALDEAYKLAEDTTAYIWDLSKQF